MAGAGLVGSIQAADSGFPLLVSLTATLTATTPISHRLRLSCKRPLAASAQQLTRQKPQPGRAGNGLPEGLAPSINTPPREVGKGSVQARLPTHRIPNGQRLGN